MHPYESNLGEEDINFPEQFAQYDKSFRDVPDNEMLKSMFVPCKPKAQKKGVKSEKKEKASTSSGSQNLVEKNLKQALEDIRQKEQVGDAQPVIAKKIINVNGALWTGNKAPSNPASGKKERDRRRSPERENNSQRKLFENRSVNKKSPSPERRAGRSRCGSPRRSPPVRRSSPEWKRQVRIVQSRDAETRRVKRINSRSRSRSRTPRRRYFGSRSRSKSRSPTYRSKSRISPDYSNRRWGRASRSPPRHRSPFNSSQRTVVISRRSRSRTPSPSTAKRFKDSSLNDQPTQLFTRGYVARNTEEQITVNTAPVNHMVLGAPIPQQQQTSPDLYTNFISPPGPIHPPPVYPPVQPPPPVHVMAYINHQQQQEHYRQQVAAQIQAAQLYHQQQHQIAMAMAVNNGSSGLVTQVPQVANYSHPPPLVNESPVAPEVAQAAKAAEDTARLRMGRDQLLLKQSQVIEELLKLAIKQADLELKQKLSTNTAERERCTAEIIANTKLENEMTAAAQSLQKLLLKHTTQLKEDLEEVRAAKATKQYRFFDQKQHWCKLCDVVVDKVSDYLAHLHSKDHEERVQATGVPSSPWHKKQQPQPEEDPDREVMMIPFRGLQCIQPVRSFYCELCDVWMGDVHCAQLHMNSPKHNDNYLKHSMERPGWAMNFAQDRQEALRRNSVRMRMQATAERQKKEAEKRRIESELEEVKKKREEERLEMQKKLQEKNKMVEKRWQKHVEQEEAKKLTVVELTDENVVNTTTVNPTDDAKSDPSPKSIRLNIHSAMTSKSDSEVNQNEQIDDVSPQDETTPKAGKKPVETIDVEMEEDLQVKEMARDETLATANERSNGSNALPESNAQGLTEKEVVGVEQEIRKRTVSEADVAVENPSAMDVEHETRKEQPIDDVSSKEETKDDVEAADDHLEAVEEPHERKESVSDLDNTLPLVLEETEENQEDSPTSPSDLNNPHSTLVQNEGNILEQDPSTVEPSEDVPNSGLNTVGELVTNKSSELKVFSPVKDDQVEENANEFNPAVGTSKSHQMQPDNEEQVARNCLKDFACDPAPISDEQEKEEQQPTEIGQSRPPAINSYAFEEESMDTFAIQPIGASSPAPTSTVAPPQEENGPSNVPRSIPVYLSVVKREHGEPSNGSYGPIPMLIPIKQERDFFSTDSFSSAPRPLSVSNNLISDSTARDIDDDDCRFIEEVKAAAASSEDQCPSDSISIELALSPNESVNDSTASGDCCFVMEVPKQSIVADVIDLEPESEAIVVTPVSGESTVLQYDSQVGNDISSVETSGDATNKENKVSPEISVQLCDFIVLSETDGTDECNLELEKVPLSGLELTSAAQLETTGDSSSTQDS